MNEQKQTVRARKSVVYKLINKPFVIVSLLCLVMASILSGCNTVGSSTAKFSGQSEQAIFDGGVHDLKRRNYSGAVSHFNALDTLYPFSKYGQQAQLNLIYAYYKLGKTPLALAACQRYIRLYPNSEDVDYAYYMRGIIDMYKNRNLLERFLPSDPSLRDLSGLKSSYMDFDLLLKSYPNSPYKADAVQRMVFIRNMLARHQLLVAEYYYNNRAYVAAANRANYVVQHFQESPAVPEALVMMIRAYRRLDLTDQAQQTMRILSYNFPNSNYLQQAKKL
ncbi:MAG: outer membrane protein assembly factor BamD [Pseudomonadota bacterium]